MAIEIPDWIADGEDDNRKWLSTGKVDVPDRIFRTDSIDGVAGPWIAVKGFIEQTNRLFGRQVFGFIRGLLVPEDEAEGVVTMLEVEGYLGNDYIPSEPSDYYTYSGEIPWRYCKKLWMEFSGGVLGFLDSVDELDSLNDVGKHG